MAGRRLAERLRQAVEKSIHSGPALHGRISGERGRSNDQLREFGQSQAVELESRQASVDVGRNM
jgi:hypothetical protein